MTFGESIVHAGVGGVFGAAGALFGNRQRREAQSREHQHQWDMAQAAWNRDDNAVQRRAADLQAAGISPLMAAGQAAGVSAHHAGGGMTSPENVGAAASGGMSAGMSRQLTRGQIKQVEANADYTDTLKDEAEATGVDTRTNLRAQAVQARANAQLAHQQAIKTVEDNRRAELESNRLQAMGYADIISRNVANLQAMHDFNINRLEGRRGNDPRGRIETEAGGLFRALRGRSAVGQGITQHPADSYQHGIFINRTIPSVDFHTPHTRRTNR